MIHSCVWSWNSKYFDGILRIPLESSNGSFYLGDFRAETWKCFVLIQGFSSTRGREAIWSCCFWILIFWMLWSWLYYMKQSCYFFIALHHQWNFQTSKWSVNWLALFPSIFKNNKTRRNSRTEQFKEIHATFQTMTKLESNILGGTPVRISRFLNYASTYRLPKDLPIVCTFGEEIRQLWSLRQDLFDNEGTGIVPNK